MTTLLFTTSPDHDIARQVKRLRELSPLSPFAPHTIDFVREFSRRILQLPELRQFPELATLAHWFRPAAIEHLSRLAVAGRDQDVTLARGLVFHLAPANVDVLFAYAWLMSVLSGNGNLARLSQKPSAQRDALIRILRDMRTNGGHEQVLDRTVLLTYPHDDKITASLSLCCHARIIWGGDQTVTHIRSIPLAPLAVELAFPDRFGVAAFNARCFADLGEDELAELARRFCNDTLWFGQQACSSPRTVYWIGEPAAVEVAQTRFWPKVNNAATSHDDEPAALMARATDAHMMAAQGIPLKLSGSLSQFPLRLSAPWADDKMREKQSGHGLLIEVALPELSALAPQLDDRDQTLVHHGFDPEQLRQFVCALHNRAIDRIVPLGRALDFHHVWDGTDLLGTLTRRIVCPTR
jgi:hypothetical protein